MGAVGNGSQRNVTESKGSVGVSSKGTAGTGVAAMDRNVWVWNELEGQSWIVWKGRQRPGPDGQHRVEVERVATKRFGLAVKVGTAKVRLGAASSAKDGQHRPAWECCGSDRSTLVRIGENRQ